MLNGFYTAASGMLTQERILGTLSNNFANTRTPGFKRDETVSTTFDHELMVRLQGGKTSKLGASTSPLRTVQETITDYTQSDFESTNRSLDMAIEGEGFFVIQNGEEEPLFTRNGQFSIDQEGYLVMPQLGRVLGESGEIQVNGDNFVVGEKGQVYVNGAIVDKLMIATPEDYTKVIKTAEGFFKDISGETNMEISSNTKIRQGAVERANVNVSEEMSKIMTAQRAIQSSAQALKMIDAMNQRTVSEIGRV